jgi:hypothetical protein
VAATRFAALSAVSVLLLAAHVGTARAADAPQPPVAPTVPTIAVQVDVGVPGVSVDVQVGTVDVSASTADVEVSVSVSSEGTVVNTDPAAAVPQQTTQHDGSDTCCTGNAMEVAPAHSSATTTRPTPAPPLERRARPALEAVASAARTPTIRIPRVDRPTRVLPAQTVPAGATVRRATPRIARRGCCTNAQAETAAATLKGVGPRPRAEPRTDMDETTQARSAAAPETGVVHDNRLLLQFGVLAAFLYLACLGGWFSATRLRRRRA